MNFLSPQVLDYRFFDPCPHLIFVKQSQSASIPLSMPPILYLLILHT